MPTYEYACTACGHRLEAVQSFSDEPLTVCPECQGPLRKVYAPVGIVLKGSGFYKTDSRAANGSSKKKGEDAGTKKEGAGESGGTKAAESSPAGSDTSGTSTSGTSKDTSPATSSTG